MPFHLGSGGPLFESLLLLEFLSLLSELPLVKPSTSLSHTSLPFPLPRLHHSSLNGLSLPLFHHLSNFQDLKSCHLFHPHLGKNCRRSLYDSLSSFLFCLTPRVAIWGEAWTNSLGAPLSTFKANSSVPKVFQNRERLVHTNAPSLMVWLHVVRDLLFLHLALARYSF